MGIPNSNGVGTSSGAAKALHVRETTLTQYVDEVATTHAQDAAVAPDTNIAEQVV